MPENNDKNKENSTPVLNSPVSNNWIIENQTARRIAIKSKDNTQLVIYPFGSIILSDAIKKQYDELDDWKQRNLIIVREQDQVNDTSEMIIGCFSMLFILFLFVAIILGIKDHKWNYLMFGLIISVVIFIGVYIFFKMKKKHMGLRIKETIKQLPALFVVLSIVIGIPFVFAYSRWLLNGLTHVEYVVISMLLVFTSLASLLPILMYFLFGRQRIDHLKNNFIREVMMLDPYIKTISEARTKYDSLFNSVYGLRGAPWDSLPIYISATFITFGWVLIMFVRSQDPFPGITNNIITLYKPYKPNIDVLKFGFLGSYSFAINMVFRRYVRADLTMKTYTNISIRFLVTSILVVVMCSVQSLLPSVDGVIFILAFVIGVFPETGFMLINSVFRKYFGNFIKPINEQYPVTKLEGVSIYDQAQLLEEGIDNIENLAHHNLMELVARIRIPVSRLVDLFDQAILYLHLGKDEQRLEETRQQLREYGIRTATDLLQVMKRKDSFNLQGILKNDSLFNKLNVIKITFADDEWMAYLTHWRESTSENENIAYLENFCSENLQVKK